VANDGPNGFAPYHDSVMDDVGSPISIWFEFDEFEVAFVTEYGDCAEAG
jgi:hypothetical protein